jgi:hypothetical protein
LYIFISMKTSTDYFFVSLLGNYMRHVFSCCPSVTGLYAQHLNFKVEFHKIVHVRWIPGRHVYFIF